MRSLVAATLEAGGAEGEGILGGEVTTTQEIPEDCNPDWKCLIDNFTSKKPRKPRKSQSKHKLSEQVAQTTPIEADSDSTAATDDAAGADQL